MAAGCRSPALDGLRTFAFLAVFAYHSDYGQGGPFVGGWIGVEVFFVLSGYLITTLLLVQRDRAGTLAVGSFWLRRLARLYPALVLAVVLAAVLSIVLPRADVGARPLWAFLALTYTSDFYFAFGRTDLGVLTHTWTLAVEEQFYLLWPLVLLAVAPRRLLRLTLVAAVALWAVMPLLGDPAGTAFQPAVLSRSWALLAGCALAVVLLEHGVPRGAARVASIAGPALVLAAVALPLALHNLWYEDLAVQPLLAVAGTAAILAAVQQPGWLFRLLALPPLPQLGLLSYGAYLYHLPVLGLVGPVLPLRRSLGLVLCLGDTLVLAWASYRFVERPILDRTPRTVRRRPVVVDVRAGSGEGGGGEEGGAGEGVAEAHGASLGRGRRAERTHVCAPRGSAPGFPRRAAP